MRYKRKISAVVLAALLVFVSSLSWAYNWVPEVKPVLYKGIVFTAPHVNGALGLVEAWDVRKGLKVWEKALYTLTVDPDGYEEDTQWIFIKDLFVQDGNLVAVDQTGRRFVEPLSGMGLSFADDVRIVQIRSGRGQILVDGLDCGNDMARVAREVMSIAKSDPKAIYEVKIDDMLQPGQVESYRSLLEETGIVLQHFWVPVSAYRGGRADTYSASQDILPDLVMMQGKQEKE